MESGEILGRAPSFACWKSLNGVYALGNMNILLRAERSERGASLYPKHAFNTLAAGIIFLIFPFLILFLILKIAENCKRLA